MTDKKQSANVGIVSESQRIKNLERWLIEEKIFPDLDLDSLRGSIEDRGITTQECEEFFRRYSMFVRDYVSGLIANRLKSLHDADKNPLEKTPEEQEKVYDIRMDNLEMGNRTRGCLKSEEIDYLGQLAERSEREMLKLYNFGRKNLNELKDILGQYNLGFGMEINYEIPEER